MLTMLIISILLVALYAGATIWTIHVAERKPWRESLPESFSAMVFTLPKGGWRWLWSAWLLAVAVTAFAPAVEALDAHGLGVLGFLPMASLGFVAVWPLFDTDHRRWHYAFAVLAGVSSQVAALLVYSPAVVLPWGVFAVSCFYGIIGCLLSGIKVKEMFGENIVLYLESQCALTYFAAMVIRL